MRALALFCLVVMTLNACGPLPRPFGRDEGDSGNKLARDIFFEGVEVQPLDGTTLPMGKLIADSIIRGLEKTHEIPAAMTGFDLLCRPVRPPKPIVGYHFGLPSA